MTTDRSFEDPQVSRIAISTINGETIVRVPPSRSVFTVVFMLVWLCGWTVGGLAAFKQLLFGAGQGEAQSFLAFWLCAWAVGWLVAAGTLTWQIFGLEVIRATTVALTHSYHVFFWSRTRKYNPASITRLRWKEGNGSQWSRYGDPSSVAFDYGAKTILMAKGTDSGEGEFLVDALRKRLGLEKARP